MEFPKVSNIFEHPVKSDTEEFYPLLSTESFKLEKIVSYGQATPEGQWYDQEQIEWVMLIKGTARLRFEPERLVTLKEGDFLTIPAHLKHRVEECSGDAVWLALHYIVDS
jgi:cupin 2 domain-containing protein